MSEYIAEVIQGEYNLAYDGYEHYTKVDYSKPIVRCRDCKHELDGWCFRPDGDGDFMRFGIEPDGFYAWGDRA